MSTLRTAGGTTPRLPYLIWSYDYSHASAGPKALHRLCHELNRAGERAYIGNGYATNPEWNTPHPAPTDLFAEFVAIYPEVVSGNPWRAPHVARWVLNTPGKLGGDTSYAPTEMVFTWDPAYLAGVPVLQAPTVETDIYADRHELRAGVLVYVGKGPAISVSGATEITLEMRQDRHALADALNHAEVLYCLDAHSGMAQLALVCGCPVRLVSTGELLEPDPDRYPAIERAFVEQLRAFTEITQAAGVPA